MFATSTTCSSLTGKKYTPLRTTAIIHQNKIKTMSNETTFFKYLCIFLSIIVLLSLKAWADCETVISWCWKEFSKGARLPDRFPRPSRFRKFLRTIFLLRPFCLMIIICVALASCSTTRASKSNNGCGSENYKHKFRVMWIRHTGPFYVVRVENMKERMNIMYEGSLPDSIIEGKWICL